MDEVHGSDGDSPEANWQLPNPAILICAT